MTAIPRQVLLAWVQSALQAARSGRRPAMQPTGHGTLVEDLERLAAQIKSLELAAEETT
ncbi:MAG TPA: hypothetical protein VH600_11440 [Burkholderiales bacterium]|jgi:hypothetical protein